MTCMSGKKAVSYKMTANDHIMSWQQREHNDRRKDNNGKIIFQTRRNGKLKDSQCADDRLQLL